MKNIPKILTAVLVFATAAAASAEEQRFIIVRHGNGVSYLHRAESSSTTVGVYANGRGVSSGRAAQDASGATTLQPRPDAHGQTFLLNTSDPGALVVP